MRITILFGGTNKERLVSVASAQALHQALPEADLWFWDVDDTVHEVRSQALLNHARPFEDAFKPDGHGVRIEQALDRAKAEDRLLVLGLHGGRAENGELQAMCGLVESCLRQGRGEAVCGDRGRNGARRYRAG
jgi:D-alanine-D-alanine ligase